MKAPWFTVKCIITPISPLQGRISCRVILFFFLCAFSPGVMLALDLSVLLLISMCFLYCIFVIVTFLVLHAGSRRKYAQLTKVSICRQQQQTLDCDGSLSHFRILLCGGSHLTMGVVQCMSHEYHPLALITS